jgi:hypothetical protein
MQHDVPAPTFSATSRQLIVCYLHEVHGENALWAGHVRTYVRPHVSTEEPLGRGWNLVWLFSHLGPPLKRTFRRPTVGSKQTADEESCEMGRTVPKSGAAFWWPKSEP